MSSCSDLLSVEFRKYRSELDAASFAELPRRLPARTASKRQWDAFDAWVDDNFNATPLRRALARYAVNVEETSLGGVRVAVVSPRDGVADENKDRILVNLHGGGFVFHRGLRCGQLESIPVAALGRIKVMTLDYRQAPFHRYPAASEDVEAVFQELLQRYQPESIGIYGCSAGAVLAAQSIARFQSRGLPRPGAIGIFSMAPPPPFPIIPPWEAGWGESGIWFATGDHNQPSSDDWKVWQAVQWYMEGVAISDPIAYPGASDETIARFPPTLFLSGSRDFAVSTILTAHTRFLRAGVPAFLYLMEGVGHVEHIFAVDTPEAHDAHANTARWFQRTLA